MDALQYFVPDKLKLALHTAEPAKTATEVAAEQYARHISEFREQCRRQVATIEERREGMVRDEELFTVMRAANGFYARMVDGRCVIGATLSEACTAAAAEVAKKVIEEPDDDGVAKTKKSGLWQRVR